MSAHQVLTQARQLNAQLRFDEGVPSDAREKILEANNQLISVLERAQPDTTFKAFMGAMQDKANNYSDGANLANLATLALMLTSVAGALSVPFWNYESTQTTSLVVALSSLAATIGTMGVGSMLSDQASRLKKQVEQASEWAFGLQQPGINGVPLDQLAEAA